MTTSDAAKKSAAAKAKAGEAAKQPDTEEVIAAKPSGDATERRDAPADQDPGIDRPSGVLITGEDAEGRPLTTDDVASGKKPVAPGSSKDSKDDESVRSTEVTWNGMTAHDTVDGVLQAPRPATLAEQLPLVANDLLSLVVGSVPYASSGSVEVDGTTLTISLVSH